MSDFLLCVVKSVVKFRDMGILCPPQIRGGKHGDSVSTFDSTTVSGKQAKEILRGNAGVKESGSCRRRTQVSSTTLRMKCQHPISQAQMRDWVESTAVHSSSIFCRSPSVASSSMLGLYNLKVPIMGSNPTFVPSEHL